MLLEGGTVVEADPRHAPGDDRGAHRPAAPEREAAAPARRRDRPDLLGGRGRAPACPRSTTSSRCSTTCSCATSSRARAARRSRGEHAYRFKHVLIRDVAYAGLAKGARAELHQQVADWLHGGRGRGARRDPRLPPRPRGDAARGARRRAPGGARHARGGRAREGGPPRARAGGEPGRRGACSSAPSSSSRRSSAASSPPGPHAGSPICRRRRSRWSASSPTRPTPATSASRASR